MKYARFINNTETSYNRITCYNIGDSIFSIAADEILQYCGIDEADIIDVPIYGNADVDEPCRMLLTGHLGRQYDMDFMRNPHILPVCIGIGLKDSYMTNEEISYFKKYEPILCRDEFTRKVLRNNGIEAYLFGCITLLLNSRPRNPLADKYYFVDVSDKDYEYLSERIEGAKVRLSQNVKLADADSFDGKSIAKTRLLDYAQNAKAIITSKLHCMTPCVGLGVPVIAASDNFSFRYSYIDAFVNRVDTFGNMPLNMTDALPHNEVKPIQVKMRHIIKSILDGEPDYAAISEIDDFYMQRNRWDYFVGIRKRLDSIFGESLSQHYLLWGASSGGYAIKACIEHYYPSASCIGVVDSNISGIFGGHTVVLPESVQWNQLDAVIIVASISGYKAISSYLDNVGMKENMDYHFLHENMSTMNHS